MTHRDGLPALSVRSVPRSDAAHRKVCATTSERSGRPPFRSRTRSVGGRRKALTMRRIACGLVPTRRGRVRDLYGSLSVLLGISKVKRFVSKRKRMCSRPRVRRDAPNYAVPERAAITASVTCRVFALPPRSRGNTAPSPVTCSIAAIRRFAAAVSPR